MTSEIPFNGTKVLDDGFVGLVNHMGDDSAIVQAARISYGKDNRKPHYNEDFPLPTLTPEQIKENKELEEQAKKDTALIRYLMRHRHTTPFEMVEFKFIIRIPMDCWRQMIRHRTASVNEYSTRYTEAIDSMAKTEPDQWRLQSSSNKQGSENYLEEWPDEDKVFVSYNESHCTYNVIHRTETWNHGWEIPFDWWEELGYMESPNSSNEPTPGQALTYLEKKNQSNISDLYKLRIDLGVAREQARKDLPLSTYTEAYWKIDLHNLFHFLSLRLDSHAQWEISQYANALYSLIKPIVPIACQAFEDYRLNAVTFSAMEMQVLRECAKGEYSVIEATLNKLGITLSERELKEFKEKLASCST